MNDLTDDQTNYLTFCAEQRGLSDHSLRAYAQDLACYQSWAGTKSTCPSDASQTLLAYLRYLRETRKSSPSTIRRRIVTLKAFLKWHAKRNHCRSPISDGLELDLRLPRRLPRPIERHVLADFLAATPRILPQAAIINEKASPLPANINQTTGLAARMLVVTGLRIGELTNLKIKDVSGTGGRVRVHGKGDRERTVYVTNEKLLADLAAYREARLTQARPDEVLFVNSRGRRLSEAAFRKRLRQASNQLQIVPHLTPHQFRHSAATLLIEEGVDIRLVQRLLGHASISTTEAYTKVSDTSLRNAIERADTLSEVDSELR